MDISDLDFEGPAYQQVSEPYSDQWELMNDQLARLDYRFYLFTSTISGWGLKTI